MKDENIFESVQFINEGLTSYLAAAISPNSFGLALIGVSIIAGIIIKSQEKNKVRNALKHALNNNKDLKPLKDKMKKGVRIISADQLAKRIKIDEKDVDTIKKYDVSVMIIVDNDDKIIAYCLVMPDSKNIRFGYNIVDKSLHNKEIDYFIRASFELKLGVADEGIKHFIKKPGILNQKKETKDDIEKHTNYMSEDESKDVYDTIKTLANDLYSKFKSAVSGVKSTDIDEYGNSFYVYLTCDELDMDYGDVDEDEYDDVYEKDEKVFDNINKKLTTILKRIGFEYNSSNVSFTSTEDKYKHIQIKLDTNEAFGNYYIRVSTSKRLKLK